MNIKFKIGVANFLNFTLELQALTCKGRRIAEDKTCKGRRIEELFDDEIKIINLRPASLITDIQDHISH